jgi:heme a synthase
VTDVSLSVENRGEVPEPRGLRSRAFARYAWGVLGYLVLVILFGGWVRITGSGAGCGSHWPTCHGQIIPRAPEAETVIEYTHRLTSGVLGVVVLVLVGWAFVTFPGRHRVRIAALVTLAFTLLEAAIGAGLVLAELVANDDSVARAVVVAIHLAATFSLTAATALTAFWAGSGGRPRWGTTLPPVRWWLVLAAAGVVVASMTGAVTALGDTLFPVSPTEGSGIFSRLRDDISPASHFLVRLRIVHPILAVLVALVLVGLPNVLDERLVGDRAARLLEALRWCVIAQVGVGLANIWWGAPGGIQIAHLALAQVVWVLVVLALAAALASPGNAGQRMPRLASAS